MVKIKKDDPCIEVICGSICHEATLPSPDVTLRWTYEKRAERRFSSPSALRNQLIRDEQAVEELFAEVE